MAVVPHTNLFLVMNMVERLREQDLTRIEELLKQPFLLEDDANLLRRLAERQNYPLKWRRYDLTKQEWKDLESM